MATLGDLLIKASQSGLQEEVEDIILTEGSDTVKFDKLRGHVSTVLNFVRDEGENLDKMLMHSVDTGEHTIYVLEQKHTYSAL